MFMAYKRAMMLMHDLFTGYKAHRDGTSYYKSSRTCEETKKVPYLIGKSAQRLQTRTEKTSKMHRLERLGDLPEDPKIGKPVQCSLPGEGRAATHLCKGWVAQKQQTLAEGMTYILVQLRQGPDSPLLPVLLTNLRISETDQPKILRFAEQHPEEDPDQKELGGTYTEEEAVRMLQAIYRTKQSREELSGMVRQRYKKRRDPESDPKNPKYYYINTHTKAVSWNKPGLLSLWKLGDLQTDEEEIDHAAHVICRTFLKLLNLKRLFTNDYYEALIFQQYGKKHDMAVIFEDPTERRAKQRGLAMDLRNSVNNKLVLAGASTNKDGQELTIVDQLQAAFSKFDSDGGGFIDEIELGNLLRYLGNPQSKQQVHELMYYLDSSGDGYVGFDEFRAWWNQSA